MSMMTGTRTMMSRRVPRIRHARAFCAALALTTTLGGLAALRPAAASPLLIAQAPSASPGGGTLTVVERSITQDQGGWLIAYRLRYQGGAGMVVTPTEVLAKVEGWVSNSRVAAHSAPRFSSMVISGASGLAATSELVSSADEAHRCRERAVVQVWTEDPSAGQDTPAPPTVSVAGRVAAAEKQPVLSVAPGSMVRARVRLEHLHFLYGDYDPLLGNRTLDVQIGGASFHDALPLDREQYLALPRFAWPAAPAEFRDTRHFLSAPESIRVEAHVPGNQYFRFPEHPVRYNTRMRLKFAYYIAGGTEGECRARVAQYKDTPTAWKVLSDGGFEECLTKVGRWVKVEKVFCTEREATTLALDFRITGAEVGAMWIDDVSLEPVTACASRDTP